MHTNLLQSYGPRCYDVPMIKAFLFDYGGVISAGGAGNDLTQKLATNLGISEEAAMPLIIPAWHKFSRGTLSEDKLWHDVEARYGKPISPDQRKVWDTWQDMQPIPAMLELLQRLKAGGYRLGLLSTTIPNTADDVRSHGGYALFDFMILSYETGYAKPEPEAYTAALAQLPGIQPNEVVYLDDRAPLLPPAQALGMQTILVSSPDQAIAAVQALLDA
jgi:HAD superfamily hydrolase (TIGR01509 family)